MERMPITAKGYKQLQEEHSQLIKVARPKIIDDIATARAHGDLKENAEYHAAKERQGFIEGRIQRLNYVLANSEVVDVAKTHANDIRFGATVTYEDLETGDQAMWKIVGEEETNVEKREISIKSPIAQSLLGKEEGDEATLRVPKGSIEVEIISVEYK